MSGTWLRGPARGATPPLSALLSALAVLCAAALTAGCSGETPEANARPDGGFGRGPAAVATVHATAASLDDVFLDREATLLPVASPTISTRQEGFVLELGPEVGDVVHAGEVLARIDDTERKLELAEANAELVQARASFAEAQRAWSRTEKLFAQDVVSEEDRDDKKAQLDIARAEVDRARVRVQRTKQALSEVEILAPSPGVVTELLAERGEYLERGDAIFELKQTNVMVALCTVGERYIADVPEGSSVFVHVTAFPDRVFDGLVWKIVPDALVNSRAFPLKILLPNPDLELKPGMSARVSFVRRIEDGLLIPKDAVLRDGDDAYVLVVEDGHAARRDVELGNPVEERYHVRAGIELDDEVIVSGNEKLDLGAEVKVVELPDAGPPTLSPAPPNEPAVASPPVLEDSGV